MSVADGRVADAEALARLQDLFAAQRKAFAAEPYPTLP